MALAMWAGQGLGRFGAWVTAVSLAEPCCRCEDAGWGLRGAEGVVGPSTNPMLEEALGVLGEGCLPTVPASLIH